MEVRSQDRTIYLGMDSTEAEGCFERACKKAPYKVEVYKIFNGEKILLKRKEWREFPHTKAP
jgi:hypothetical protein